eukprot:6421086-Ditylum_brightwellii.AAC.2
MTRMQTREAQFPILHMWLEPSPKSNCKMQPNRRKETPPADLRITIELPIIHWTEAFDNYLDRKAGVRTFPHQLCDKRGQGAHKTSTHSRPPSCRKDNANVHFTLEEATRKTQYFASIKPFQRVKGGQYRGVFISMEEAAAHVLFQLPNEFTQVGFLLTVIKCSDAGL